MRFALILLLFTISISIYSNDEDKTPHITFELPDWSAPSFPSEIISESPAQEVASPTYPFEGIDLPEPPEQIGDFKVITFDDLTPEDIEKAKEYINCLLYTSPSPRDRG